METLDLSRAGVRLVPATKVHARVLGRTMRAADRDEILASGAWSSPERCVRANMNRSIQAWAAYAGEDLLCVFGVTPHTEPGIFIPWALTAEPVNRHKLAFYKASKLFIEWLRGKCRFMFQMVHGKYTASIAWLSKLGFEIYPPEKFGKRGDLFCPVILVTQELIHV